MEVIMEYITLEKNNVQRFGIKTADGKETGEYIEIDPEDIDFQFRANDCQNEHLKNVEELEKKVKEIDANYNNEGNFPTQKDIARREAIVDFLKKEEETIDRFIGDGTTRKILNGRKPYIFMFNDIMNTLCQIVPSLQDTSKKIIDNIKEKYNKNKEKENVI